MMYMLIHDPYQLFEDVQGRLSGEECLLYLWGKNAYDFGRRPPYIVSVEKATPGQLTTSRLAPDEIINTLKDLIEPLRAL